MKQTPPPLSLFRRLPCCSKLPAQKRTAQLIGNLTYEQSWSTMAVMRLSTISTAAATLLLVSAVINLGTAAAQSGSNVKARYHYYSPEENKWSLDDAHAYCATWYDNKPLSWKKEYGWAAYCGSSAPTGKAACGKCLKVTNVKSGASVTVRIVDQCKRGELSLDTNVFRYLDTDHSGFVQGYLTVNYQSVTC